MTLSDLISSVFAAVLTVTSIANATPSPYRHQLMKRQNETMGGGGGVNASNMTNGTMPNNASNSTGAGQGTGTEQSAGQLQIFVTGGEVPIYTNYSTTTIFNVSGALNISQLYTVASQVNLSLSNSNTSGIVIVASKKSIESLGFFSSIVFDTEKPIVITTNVTLGISVANDPDSASHGVLIVSNDRIIYDAGLPVWSVAAGVVGDDDKVRWFYSTAKSQLTNSTSIIRTTYSNFTNPNIQNASIVPILFETSLSSSLTSNLNKDIQGLVVVSSGSSNKTSSSLASDQLTIPIVVTHNSKIISYLNNSTLPDNVIAGGWLTPIQAQILLYIALSNGVNDTESLKQIFP